MGFFDKFTRSKENECADKPGATPPPLPESIKGRSATNGILEIGITDVTISKLPNCVVLCPDTTTCRFLDFGVNNGSKNFKTTEITITIENLTKSAEEVMYNDFCAIDADNITHRPQRFCSRYSYPCLSEYCFKIPPHSKIRSVLIFPTIDNGVKGIIYQSKVPISIRYGEQTTQADAKDIIIDELRNNIASLHERIEQLKLEKQNINANSNAPVGHPHDANLVKHTISEDEEWFIIYSNEEAFTLSFNREFDKSKDNYNWINVGDALISLRYDNVPLSYKAATLISSPVSGLFEFSKNKLIRFGEEICRIKKIEPSFKEATIEALEREEIKLSVYKKERKKMIERETLDELIAEGKVFNVITNKNGNRMAIPSDVANAVWNRDGGKCCYCGSKSDLEFDHIIPISKGGATTFRNLQLLCKACNLKKSDHI